MVASADEFRGCFFAYAFEYALENDAAFAYAPAREVIAISATLKEKHNNT